MVALVGENGAGKTHAREAARRMYAPTSGRILIDGVDLARMAPDEWRERLAGAFQDFFRFELLAQATVGVGDLPAHRRPARGRRARSAAPAPTT